MTGKESHRITKAASVVRARLGPEMPTVAVVLGSGAGALAAAIDSPVRIRYDEIPGFPHTTVAGHGGELIAGRLGTTRVLLQSGRYHLYEGHAPETVVRPVRVFRALGCTTLIVTNAAGGIDPLMRPPALMSIADHINLQFQSPLAGAAVGAEPRFPDLLHAYDPALRRLARRVARENGIPLADGVYAGVLGPAYETPAEIRMLERMGADAVGMSTVPEVVTARAAGLRVLGVSTITNFAAGLSQEVLAHRDVLRAGAKVSGMLEALIRGVVQNLTAPRLGA